MTGLFTPPTDIAAVTKALSSQVNDLSAAVEVMDNKLPTEVEIKRGTISFGVDTGAADAYLVALPYTPSGYVSGLRVEFLPLATNTGASTINLNSLGVKSLKRSDGTALSAGDITVGTPVHAQYSTVTGYMHMLGNSAVDTAAAAASASAAASSASAASSSASSASTSASTATTQASNASTSASTASTQATNASTSASNASTSATNAATSATNAATSATNASNSASTATTQATNASNSASTASTQATNASTSATNAATSATNAATSETNAAASAAAAAASAADAFLPVATAGGTVNAVTADYSPNIALTDGQACRVVLAGANTSTTPTFAPDGLTAHTITKLGGSALIAGDLPGALAVAMLQYDLANTRWELLNPPSMASGSWTPVFTFATMGDLSVAYSTQSGAWARHGSQITVDFQIITSTFTHTTASGNVEITGLPFAVNSTAGNVGAIEFQGITKATYTNFVTKTVASASKFRLVAGGSGVASSNVAAADMPTGGTVRLIGSFTYTV